ncbi:hypothetical protein ACJJID_05015 [Microbulbifer sp. CnH-101-G]|uniref:hypothetical protein n=1 Tax=Microbulbifer sp. CnH-101-G TaxID=3243393 RepID=UPI0040390399
MLEVEQFCAAFFIKRKSNAAIANTRMPVFERWQIRYKSALAAYKQPRKCLSAENMRVMEQLADNTV